MPRNNSPRRDPNVVATRSNPVSLTCLRFTLFLLFVAVGGISYYFSTLLKTLSFKIQLDEKKISNMQSLIEDQEKIIGRFSDQVSNTDVIARVDRLENEMDISIESMQIQLNTTEKHISTIVNNTFNELNQIISTAQNQLHEEVLSEKAVVDQYVRTTQDQFSLENSFMVYQLAGTFTLIASLISMWHMTSHLRFFKRPHVQRKILAILWMSPIYGVTSWLSLVFPQFEGYLAIIKDFYEAYVIYQFLGFLISVIGKGDRDMVVDELSKHAGHLDPPMRLFGWCRHKYDFESDRDLADAVLLQCQTFCMQFVFLKPLTATSMFVCNKLGYYGEGTSSSDYRSPQFWINIVQNISVFLAFSGLIKFYHAVQDNISWCRPFPKFLCIKGIVFMTFWQGLVISILASTTGNSGVNNQKGNDDPDQWGRQAQNFLICLEMLLFSIAHFYCFPTDEWREGYQPVVDKNSKFGDNIALSDFFDDLKHILDHGKDKEKKSKGKGEKSSQVGFGGGKDSSCDTCECEEGDISAENDIERNEEVCSVRSKDERSLHSVSTESSDMEPEVMEAAKNLVTTYLEKKDISNQNERNKFSPVQSHNSVHDSHTLESDDPEEPDEKTSLLGGESSSSENMLRPSIFTSL